LRFVGVLAALTLALGACNGPPSCDSSAVTNEFVDVLYHGVTTNIRQYSRFLAGEKPFWAVNTDYPEGRQADYDKLLAYLQSVTPAYRKQLNMPEYELWEHRYRRINRAVTTTLKNIKELPPEPNKRNRARCQADVVIQPKSRADGGATLHAVYAANWHSPKSRVASVMVVQIEDANVSGAPQPAYSMLRRQSPRNFAIEKLAGVLAAELGPH